MNLAKPDDMQLELVALSNDDPRPRKPKKNAPRWEWNNYYEQMEAWEDRQSLRRALRTEAGKAAETAGDKKICGKCDGEGWIPNPNLVIRDPNSSDHIDCTECDSEGWIKG